MTLALENNSVRAQVVVIKNVYIRKKSTVVCFKIGIIPSKHLKCQVLFNKLG